MSTTDDGPAAAARGGDTSARLLEAAFETFVETGFEGAKVHDIAERAGYTTGAIYGRFENKTALLAAAMAQHGASFLDIALGNLVTHPEGTTLAALAMEAMVGPATEMHQVLTDVSAIATRDAHVRAALIPLLEGVQDAFHVAIVHGQQHETIDPTLSADALVHLAVTLMLGSFVAKSLRLAQPEPDSALKVMARMLSSFMPADGSSPTGDGEDDGWSDPA